MKRQRRQRAEFRREVDEFDVAWLELVLLKLEVPMVFLR